VKTGQITLSVVQVNYAFDNELTDPDALLDAARIAREPAERRRIIDHFDRHDSWIAIGRRALEIYPT